MKTSLDNLLTMAKSDYEVEWLASFLNSCPHVDFGFQETNSTFDPEYKDYQQAIVFLAAIPAVCCILLLLFTCCCMCFHCCKQKPKMKSRTTCLRFIIALFIIFAIGSVAVGFFGNEESNKGIQTTIDAIQDGNDTITGSLNTLSTLEQLAISINNTGINQLKSALDKYLNGSVKKDTLKTAEYIRNMSLIIFSDIHNIKTNVNKISLDPLLNTVKQAEFYRWVGTIILLCVQIVVLLVFILGTLKKSKYWLVWAIVMGFASLFLAWLSTGVYLGGSVSLGDFCVDPDSYIINKLGVKVPSDIVKSYVECRDSRDPQNFSSLLDGCLTLVTQANDTLTQVVNKTLPYNISQYLNGPVRELRTDLSCAYDNISSLGSTVNCGQIHGDYVKALTGICNRAIVGMSLILLVLPILGLSLFFVQCLLPRLWLMLGTRKDYSLVDSTDPFLPHPPPYSYGSIDNERTPLREDSELLCSHRPTVMKIPQRTFSANSDSPPPAYSAGSFAQQYTNLGTFPRPNRQN